MTSPETKASERLEFEHECLNSWHIGTGRSETYDRYDADKTAFAWTVWQAARSHPAPGVMGEELDMEMFEIGAHPGARKRALAKNTPMYTKPPVSISDKSTCIETMLADIMKAKVALKIYANPDLFKGSHYPQGYSEAAKALAALEQYGEK
jgi:hypothetical protein